MKTEHCAQCRGTGHILVDGNVHECPHVLRDKAIEYLTPVYEQALYSRDLDVRPLKDKSLLIVNNMKAKTLVKSFLLNTGMIYSHKSVSAYDILQAYLTNSESRDWTALLNVDLLFIYLIQDPKNGHYGQIIGSLLHAREQQGKKSWVIARNDLNTTDSIRMYGNEIQDTLQELKFVRIS